MLTYTYNYDKSMYEWKMIKIYVPSKNLVKCQNQRSSHGQSGAHNLK